ncbi:MAG TPA: hybrid sensor histidine kinase/response regulator [Drouetiella sp.]
MQTNPKSVKVLLVENDCADAKFVLKLLNESQNQMASVSATWVATLTEALRALADTAYDAVLLNLGLPDSDGLETLISVRKYSKSLPIVVVSGSDDKQLALQTVQHGAQDFLVKGRPSGESIIRAVMYAIERCRADNAETQLKIVEEREHFIAMLAHNLSIPIIGAQRILSILTELGTLPADVCHLLTQISSSNQTLLHTINNVLDLYKYEANREQFVQTEVNFTRLVQDCVREVQTEADLKKIRFVKSFASDDVLWADPLAMRKVLLNLLNNAVKFTPIGGEVSISLRHSSGNSIMRVSDNGAGVEPELVDILFDRSFQRGVRYQADGFGLGLDLCKKFVEAQNGQIACSSKPSQGTTFEITLPQMPVADKMRPSFSVVRTCPKIYVKV